MPEKIYSYADKHYNCVKGCDPKMPCGPRCWAARECHRLADNPNPKIATFHAGLTDASGKWTGTVRLNEAHLTDPLRWRKPAVIATAYHGDLFRLPAEQIDRAFAVMALCPQHTFLTLSKCAREMEEYFAVAASRIGERFRKDMAIARMAPVRKIAAVKRIRALSFEESIEPLPLPLPNVYLGFSASNQAEFDARAPHILKLAAQGWKTWVSLEPLTGPINLSTHLHCPNCGYTAHDAGMWMDHHLCGHPSPWRLRQVVLGGESGPNARPCDIAWLRSIVRQCREASVPCFVKQITRGGKRLPMEQWPEDLRIQELFVDRSGLSITQPPDGREGASCQTSKGGRR